MGTERAQITTQCPECENKIAIQQVWEAGGINDRGGFRLRCNACQHEFDEYVGKDVYSSEVISGATLVDRYEK